MNQPNFSQYTEAQLRQVLTRIDAGRFPERGRITSIALTTYPAARRLDTLSVTLARGYDIGIASHWDTKTFNGSPGTWQH